MNKEFVRRAALACGIGFLSTNGVHADDAGRFSNLNAFVDYVAREGIASPALPQLLRDHGIELSASEDSRGTLSARDVVFGDGASLATMWVTPESVTQFGHINASVSATTCVKVDSLKAVYHLKEVPARMTAPAPSSAPGLGPVTHVRALEGRLGTATMGVTYASIDGRPTNADCVFSLSLRSANLGVVR